MKTLSAWLLVVLFSSASLLRAESLALSPDDPQCTAEDRAFMKQAYALSGEELKKGHHPFSALFVVDGKVVAEYTNQVATRHDPTQHAELGLISAYAPKISREDFGRGTLYASTEPCTMCGGAVLLAGIKRVVYGTREAQFMQFLDEYKSEKPLTFREVIARSDPTVQVYGPLMEEVGAAQHAAFWPEVVKAWKKD